MYPSYVPLLQMSPLKRRKRPFRAAAAAPVLIRRAEHGDARALDRLAALDEQELPRGDRLVGELEGRIVAALELSSGKAIADPFAPTVGVVKLLELRAAQVRS